MTLQPRNLYSEVLDGLRRMIESGEIREGERIPTERVLAERFGVSRTCVREALGALKLSGVIQGRPGAGTYLAKASPGGIDRSDLLLVEEGSPFEILESRKIIEPAIASLAARKATTADIARLAEAMENLRVSVEDAQSLTEADRQFHMCMAEATHNRILIRTLGQILDLMQRIYYPAVGIVGPHDGYYDTHNEVFRNVQERNSRGAERAMRAHLMAVELDLESLSGF
ncbi:MAG: HTH-type transcriptional regulator LutR [Firmicutes bacterium ADurb.BinA052]|nr:MAG: HTH-type transcriptional regulator LutR [Firmicutes bacterium ADurb.BinA052]